MDLLRLMVPLLVIVLCLTWAGDLARCPGGSPDQGRYVAVISDLHLGNGRKADGTWHRTEDFRWDGALRTFLERANDCGRGRTDLVIAGDMLELWQPLAQQKCKDSEGCTVDEMAVIVGSVLAAHRATLALFKVFAARQRSTRHSGQP
jgi:UDP-2,3-diacylglucosamine pyrophosphatase LpxH